MKRRTSDNARRTILNERQSFLKKRSSCKRGQSNHNFGVAYDVGVFSTTGKYIDDGPQYSTLGTIGKNLGLEWGGDWKNIVDRPHFQYPTGMTLQQMRDSVSQGIPVIR